MDVFQQRERGYQPGDKALLAAASGIAEELGLEFAGTDGWLDGWKERHGLAKRVSNLRDKIKTKITLVCGQIEDSLPRCYA